MAACFPLIPYSGPVPGGSFRFSGREHRLDRNHPNEPEPVHGVLRGTLLLAFQVMLCCLAIGFPAALFLWQRHVLWPHLATALITAGLLAFTLSLDETLITVFLAGDTMTLPLRLWAMMRVGFTPEVNALVTLVLVVTSLVTLALGWRLRRRGEFALEN